MPGNAARTLSPSLIRRFDIKEDLLKHLLYPFSAAGCGFGVGIGLDSGPGVGTDDFGFGLGVANYTISAIASASVAISSPIAVSTDTILAFRHQRLARRGHIFNFRVDIELPTSILDVYGPTTLRAFPHANPRSSVRLSH